MNQNIELRNGLIVSLESDDRVDAHVVTKDGEAGKALTIYAAAIRCALDTAHETGGWRAVRAVLGTAKQLHRAIRRGIEREMRELDAHSERHAGLLAAWQELDELIGTRGGADADI